MFNVYKINYILIKMINFSKTKSRFRSWTGLHLEDFPVSIWHLSQRPYQIHNLKVGKEFMGMISHLQSFMSFLRSFLIDILDDIQLIKFLRA